MSRLEYFRNAVKSLIAELPRNERRDYKEKIAEDADIKLSYLNDLAMGRRTGSESKRDIIAKAFGYNYSDFIALGEAVAKDRSLAEAKQIVEQRKKMRIEPDGSIEHILIDWPNKSEKDIKEMRQLNRIQLFKRTDFYNNYITSKEQSQERFQILWQSASKNEKQTLLDFDTMNLLAKYLKGELSDPDVLEYADIFFNKIYEHNQSEDLYGN